MSPTPTEQFIQALQSLKPGDLGRLRQHAGLPLDESVGAFDLFAGLWWPLRRQNQRAPRREVAWLVAKLYAFRPLPQKDGATLARQLGRLHLRHTESRLQQSFDSLLLLPLERIEPALRWALTRLADPSAGLDWVQMTDDLSIWEQEATRLNWAHVFLGLADQTPQGRSVLC